MAEKDLTARELVNKADVFADIVNGSIFILTGRWPSPRVRPEDLVDVPTHNISVSGDRVRGLERDVAKIWTVGGTVFCLMGLENQTQTKVDPDMAFRVLGYEGADYRRQLEERKAEEGKDGKKNKPYPVLTIVLYFGTDRPWPENQRSLLDLCGPVDKAMMPLFNNLHLNLVELGKLTKQQIDASYRSDFWVMADYVRQTCQNKDFVPSDKTIVHVEAVARFLSALTGDRGLVEHLPNIQKRGVPMTVRNFFGEAREQGIQIGEARGEARGIQIGQAQGIQIGQAQGGLNMLVSLVGDGSLPLAVAAKKAGMTEDEFKTRMCEQERAGES